MSAKKLLLRAALVGAATIAMSCSGSTAGSTVDLASFTGATWSIAGTTAETCANGQSTTWNSNNSFTFTATGPSGFTTGGTCAFDFAVSGDTAVLSNTPHCVSDFDGGAEAFTYSTFTLTTTDGHHLTGTTGGGATIVDAAPDGGTLTPLDCTYTGTLTGTR